MEKFYFVMPAYNEAENIESVVKQWYPIVDEINAINNCEARLVIANDGSKDNTYEIIRLLSAEYPLLTPLNKANSGHGATVLYLYRYAIENGADYVFQTDSDGQTNPKEFVQMFRMRKVYDFQIGHRKSREDGLSRVFVTKVLKIVVWFMFGEWVTDANAPFRLMKADKLQAIMNVIPADYFLCNVAIAAIAKKWHYKMRFCNISFLPRQGGINSINTKKIIKIGKQALGDFYIINKELKEQQIIENKRS